MSTVTKYPTLQALRTATERSPYDFLHDLFYVEEEGTLYTWCDYRQRTRLFALDCVPPTRREHLFTKLCDAIEEHVEDTSIPPPQPQKHTDIQLLTDMYSHLTDDVKRSLRTTHSDAPFFKNRCKCCDTHLDPSSTKTCIHHDCTGMCHTCYSNSLSSGASTCPSCDREQIITCPICTDDKKPDELLLGRTCSHAICLACFADSYRIGRPIDTCPLCRKNFH